MVRALGDHDENLNDETHAHTHTLISALDHQWQMKPYQTDNNQKR
jgi:hypothetical protein